MNKINTKILTLFKAYTAKEINEKQFVELQKWINQSTENKQLFSKYLLYYKRSRRVTFYDSLNKELAWSKVISQLSPPLLQPVKKQGVTKKTYWKYAIAASVITIISLSIFLNIKSINSTPVIVNNKIESRSNKATLTLEDGSEITLEKGKTSIIKNATSNGKEIIYQPIANKQISYNYLTIPRGGEYKIILPDSTIVWLNSESQLKYPINFTEGKPRQVELVYGEAYFDVSPSTAHNGSKFKVYNNGQEVEVLGTEFNIKTYKDETNIYTTLVEGKVSIKTDKQNRLLEPGEQSNLDIISNHISISKVNIRQETSWKDGLYIFKGKSLKEIMITLSRWYNIEVIFEEKSLEDARFTGALNKNQNIVDMLNDIKNFGAINNFEINNKTITLK
ncbi:FecR family protein [Lutibacter sp. A80]|uniref:FecR family protein n=1 Tax=Lutibacter sp. A80 TaxID=2918453 RepID=UPI001F05D794|nr:FecR family protein [Lutibacter sp. A80]UMB61586.1 FecR family protein [Lutibacter sp. A80]